MAAVRADLLGKVSAARRQDTRDLIPVGHHWMPAGEQVEGAGGEWQRRPVIIGDHDYSLLLRKFS
jgi:hypothetical protein